jgi:excisionase family DNA binding protein
MRTILWTKQEAADMLRVSLSTIDRLVSNGTLRAIHIGASIRISDKELERIGKRAFYATA